MLLGLLSSFAASFLSGVVSDLWSQWRSDRLNVATGRAEAVAASAEAAARSVAVAHAVEIEADARHRADPSDAAFDPDFERPD